MHFHKQLKPYVHNPVDPSEFFHHSIQPFQSGNYSCFPAIYLTVTIQPTDPRAKDPQFDAAREKELEVLWNCETSQLVNANEVPSYANTLRGRFVLALRHEGTAKETWNARFFVQGFRDKFKTFVVHDNSNAQPHSITILTGTAAIFGFRIFSTHVTEAYLQSNDDLVRDVYIKPAAELGISSVKMLKLLKPLYDLADSEYYCGKTLKNHLQENLNTVPSKGDEAFYFKSENSLLDGISAVYFDDILQASTNTFLKAVEQTKSKFKCKDRKYDHRQFAGMEISTTRDGFVIHQNIYASKLKLLPKNPPLSEFHLILQKVMWLTNITPDII